MFPGLGVHGVKTKNPAAPLFTFLWLGCSMNVGAFPSIGVFPISSVSSILREKRFVVTNSDNLNPSFREDDDNDFFRSPESQRRIDLLTIGIALVAPDQRILCSNKAFAHFLGRDTVPADTPFYDAVGQSEIEGPDYCPFHSALSTGHPTVTTLRVADRFFELTLSPNKTADGHLRCFVVEMRDVTPTHEINETLRKLLEIGIELADVPSHQLASNSLEDRMRLLRQKVVNGLRDILHYDICEIRLLEESTGRLLPFLAFGISSEAASRPLVASSNDNGITGYVAHNRVTYYCEETLDHPFYLCGSPDARSSLTVPLIWRDKVLGTCNVESTRPCAFTELDLYFLQIFMRDVAAALHMLNLLSYEKFFAIQDSLGAVIDSIALPTDEIFQNTAVLMDNILDSVPDSVPALQAIQEKTRVIKEMISMTRKRMASGKEIDIASVPHPLLNRRRVLVIDRDPEILRSAHNILEEYGCIVETARDALVALKMLRCSYYDAVISELKPEGGMSGYQLMLRMFELYPGMKVPPLLLSTGFGYDPGHTLVSANQKGLLGVLFKPLIPRQVIEKLEGVVSVCGRRDENGNLVPPLEIDRADSVSDPSSCGAFAGAEPAKLGEQSGRNSFFTKREGGRFKAWIDQIKDFGNGDEPDADKAAEPETDDESGFDAT